MILYSPLNDMNDFYKNVMNNNKKKYRRIDLCKPQRQIGSFVSGIVAYQNNKLPIVNAVYITASI